MKIPLSAPDITEAEIEAVVAVLRTPRLSLGPVTEQFEAAVAEYVSLPHAVAVSSGTAGLHLCIRALGIGEGDEVIVPSFTFIAAANAIRYERATPVFADIDAAHAEHRPTEDRRSDHAQDAGYSGGPHVWGSRGYVGHSRDRSKARAAGD